VPDAAEGRALPEAAGRWGHSRVSLLTDRAYEDGRARVHLWNYDKELYKRRNEIERFFRRLKAFRGICTRYDKVARIFSAFIYLACICIALRCVNTP
jgi:transposase